MALHRTETEKTGPGQCSENTGPGIHSENTWHGAGHWFLKQVNLSIAIVFDYKHFNYLRTCSPIHGHVVLIDDEICDISPFTCRLFTDSSLFLCYVQMAFVLRLFPSDVLQRLFSIVCNLRLCLTIDSQLTLSFLIHCMSGVHCQVIYRKVYDFFFLLLLFFFYIHKRQKPVFST